MNKPKNLTKHTSSGAPTKSSHAKGRSLKKETHNISEDERELQALQQAFHQLTKTRRAQEIKTQETLRKQSQLIGSLKAERQSLQEELEGAGHALRTKKLLSQCINALHHHSDLIDKSICQEKQTITGLQKEIHEMHRKIDKERKAAAVDVDPTSKVQRLTGQLAQVNKRFSTIVSTNSQLRQDIETMRGEKVKFLQVRSKLEKALQETHLQKDRVLQQVSESVLIREDTRARTLRVIEQTCPEEDTHAREVQDLQRQMGLVEKSEHFLQKKNKARHTDLDYCPAAERKETYKQELQVDHQEKLKKYEAAMEKISDIIQGQDRQSKSLRRGTSSERSPNPVMEPSQSTSWESANRRRSTLVGPMFREAAAGLWSEAEGVRRGRRLTEYRRRSTLLQGLRPEEQERLRQLSSTVLQQNSQQPAAGPDPQLLYNSYMKGEDLIFSLFSYLSEQNKQIDEMTRDMEELRMKMEEEQKREKAEQHRLQGRVKELRLSCQQVAQTAGTIQKEVGEKEGMLSLLREGVKSLASQAGVDTSVFDLSSSWTKDSGTRVILPLLGQIEHKINQLLTIYSYTQHQHRKGSQMDFTSAVSEIPDSRKLPDIDVQPPATSFLPESEEELCEEELKPLSREELQKRVLEMAVSHHDIDMLL